MEGRPPMPDPIDRALHEIQARRSRSAAYADASWRAAVDERLRAVEDAIADLRTRVNSVLALIAAAVIGQIALRLLGH
jgi:hypothetical protein